MPDAINTVEVDGVAPSIPVNLVNSKDNPERIKLFTADDGTERFLVKDSETPLLITPNDLAQLGGFEIEIVNDESDEVENDDNDNKETFVTAQNQPAQNRPESTLVIPTPATTPGQTG
jgi:hypothetical protein